MLQSDSVSRRGWERGRARRRARTGFIIQLMALREVGAGANRQPRNTPRAVSTVDLASLGSESLTVGGTGLAKLPGASRCRSPPARAPGSRRRGPAKPAGCTPRPRWLGASPSGLLGSDVAGPPGVFHNSL